MIRVQNAFLGLVDAEPVMASVAHGRHRRLATLGATVVALNRTFDVLVIGTYDQTRRSAFRAL